MKKTLGYVGFFTFSFIVGMLAGGQEGFDTRVPGAMTPQMATMGVPTGMNMKTVPVRGGKPGQTVIILKQP